MVGLQGGTKCAGRGKGGGGGRGRGVDVGKAWRTGSVNGSGARARGGGGVPAFAAKRGGSKRRASDDGCGRNAGKLLVNYNDN